jgi:hypothetical protein
LRPVVAQWSSHDRRHRRISLLHLRGVPWARIGEQVGQRNLAVTANMYTHVLADETELNYDDLLRVAALTCTDGSPTGSSTAGGRTAVSRARRAQYRP